MTSTRPVVDRVVVESDTTHHWKGHSKVDVVWALPGGTLDRPMVGGWIVPDHVVARLVNAINAGVIFTEVAVSTDVNGETYVSANSTAQFMAKYANADLTRLGF